MLHVCKQSRKTVTFDWIAIEYSKCVSADRTQSVVKQNTVHCPLRTQSTVARLTVLMFRNMSWSSMVALCICLRNFTDTVQWKIQEYYAPDKAFKLVFSCHSSVSYLFPLL